MTLTEFIVSDPVLWASCLLHKTICLEDYQRKMLSDRSIRKVYRGGRQVGKTLIMLIEALWKTSTKVSHKTIFVTACKPQVNILFSIIKDFFKNSPYLNNLVSKINEKNRVVLFKNGSVIKFISANSNSFEFDILGQSADNLYIDDMDYINEIDLLHLFSLTEEKGEVCCASFPHLKNGLFQNICENKSYYGFSEHYCPSIQSRRWTKEVEDILRKQLTEDEYRREIMAEFSAA